VDLAGQGVPRGETVMTQQDHVDLIAAEHGDWLEAIRAGGAPSVPGSEGRRSVALIEACYQQRRPLLVPWEEAPGIPHRARSDDARG
jgi:hypothetical protein